ncbi:aminopeptidase [Streptomyces sp. CWNU-1]|uniref:Aminopeptidase n=1 Tax=Streptomyces albipurpureus TaxID=2897419 RepID=A0ABT0UMX2_9ACTN|nr:aminopeptidase [Streptomyces sp. CWNU-1]
MTSSQEITNSEHFGLRAYRVQFEQPKDHRRPAAGTFQQQVIVFHRGETLPTVLTPTQHGQGNPTGILFPKNEVKVEQRFLPDSSPHQKDLTKLTSWQLATDLHRVTVAIKGIYDQKWLSTGMGVTGQIATYHRRFYPADVQGTYVLAARNDARNNDDSAYDAFFARVGTPECRDRIASFQREALVRRDELVELYRQQAQADGDTFELIGSVDRAFEISVTDYPWKFWEHRSERLCKIVPLKSATTAVIWNELRLSAAYFRGDKDLRWNEQNLYLAGTQTGWPTVSTPHLDDLLRYPGINSPRTFVDRSIPMTFDNRAMADIDNWVRKDSSEMIYIYGKNDPVSAEAFRVDQGSKDSQVYFGAPYGGIAYLTPAEQQEITGKLRKWAGVADQPPAIR